VTSELPEFSNGCFSGIDEAIRYKPHLAIIANPAPFHIVTAQALAEIGVHLLIEKPLAASLDGVAHLLETCRKQHSVLLIGYNLRFLPSLQYFRELLLAGSLGRVMSVRCEIGQYLPSWRPESEYRLGVTARQELGGGALLELSHEIDYLCWIFGEVETVQAYISQQSRLDIDVEDTVHLILGFAPDSNAHRVIGSVDLYLIRHDTTRLCTAICEKGTLRWNGITGEVLLYEEGSSGWRTLSSLPHQRDNSYLAEWQDCIACIDGHKTPMVTGQDGLKVLKIIDAARRSSASREQVELEPK
jgi:predicted dehydrogenase